MEGHVDAAGAKADAGHLRPLGQLVQEQVVQSAAYPDSQAQLFLQRVKGNGPASIFGVGGALPDDELRRPAQFGVHDVSHSGSVSRDAGVVISLRVNKHAVIAALAQCQQAVNHAIPVEHTALVLPNKRLIRQGSDVQPAKILMGQLHHLFDLAVIHQEIARFLPKICLEFHGVFLLYLWQVAAGVSPLPVDANLEM